MATADPVSEFARAFAAGSFFEAHEILERFWIGYRGDDREFYRGLIQAAVALHHLTTGNTAGASSVAARARGKLAPYAPRHGGIDVEAVLNKLAAA